MKYKNLFLIVALALLPVLLSGCAIEERLDAAEDRIESHLEPMEEQLEASLEPLENAAEGLLSSASQNQSISEEDAKKIALDYVGMNADQVQFLQTQYEVDDRVPQYDVEFHVGHVEYEFEIHAENGTILSFDKDD